MNIKVFLIVLNLKLFVILIFLSLNYIHFGGNYEKKIAVNLFLISIFVSCTKPVKATDIRDDYISETPPGTTTKVFAPGFISTGLFKRGLAMSPDGNKFYYLVKFLDRFAIAVVKKLMVSCRNLKLPIFPDNILILNLTFSLMVRKYTLYLNVL